MSVCLRPTGRLLYSLEETAAAKHRTVIRVVNVCGNLYRNQQPKNFSRTLFADSNLHVGLQGEC